MTNESGGQDVLGSGRGLPVAVTLAAAGLAVLVGLFAGWLLFGGTATGSTPATAGPGELAPTWQAEWVQLVADDYARSRDADRALELLDGMSETDLASAFATLSGGDRTAVQQHTVGLLTEGIGPALAAGEGAASESEAGEGTDAPAAAAGESAELAPGEGAGADASAQASGEAGGDGSGLIRAVAAAVLLLAAGALAFIGWSWLSWRRQRRVARHEDADGADAAAHRRAVRGHDVGAEGESAGAPPAAGRRTAEGEVPWRPLRLDLGSTATVTYEPSDERFYQTWLVNDERGSLVGGVGLRSQDIGRVGALELWFFRRGESGTDEDTATVTLLAEPAGNDGVILARLGDRDVMVAAPGGRRVLAVADLELEVEIAAADSGVADERASLSTVTLVMTPRRASRLGEQTAAEPPEPAT